MPEQNEGGWSGQQDLNLRSDFVKPLINLDSPKRDSEYGGSPPGDARAKRRCDSAKRRRPAQLAFPFGADDHGPRLRARRDLSAAALARALARLGIAVTRAGLPVDRDGQLYGYVLRHDPLRLSRRATLAAVRRQLEAAS